MLIKCYGNLTDYEDIELSAEVSEIREVFSFLKLHHGAEFLATVLNNSYFYVLKNSKNPEDAVILDNDIFLSDFSHYDVLEIIPNIEGSTGVETVAAILGVTAEAMAAGGAAAIGVYAVAAVVNIALAVGLSMLMSLISPTPSINANTDPASSGVQNSSNLFNGAPIIREQGGSVPLIFGEPYCGGFLISSGLFTEEI